MGAETLLTAWAQGLLPSMYTSSLGFIRPQARKVPLSPSAPRCVYAPNRIGKNTSLFFFFVILGYNNFAGSEQLFYWR